MSTYSLTYVTHVSTTVTVEADDLDAAEEQAGQLLPGSLCHQCGRDRDEGDTELYSYEVDGVYHELSESVGPAGGQ